MPLQQSVLQCPETQFTLQCPAKQFSFQCPATQFTLQCFTTQFTLQVPANSLLYSALQQLFMVSSNPFYYTVPCNTFRTHWAEKQCFHRGTMVNFPVGPTGRTLHWQSLASGHISYIAHRSGRKGFSIKPSPQLGKIANLGALWT